MYYKLPSGMKKVSFFYLKKCFTTGTDETEMPESVGDEDEIQFLLPVIYE